MQVTQCLVCSHGGKLDMNKVPCSIKGAIVNIYTVKACPDYQEDRDKVIYLLMQQISNIAGMHEMTTPTEVTLGKIEERMQGIRDAVGAPDV